MSAEPGPDAGPDVGSLGSPWTGPWADDAQRVLRVLRTALDQAEDHLQAPPGPERGPHPERGPDLDATGGPTGGHERRDGPQRAEGREEGHPPECRFCPLCQAAALLRRAGPDVLDQLADVATGLAAAWREAEAAQAAAARSAAAQDASMPPAAGRGRPDGTGAARSADGADVRARPPSTVRIDVTD